MGNNFLHLAGVILATIFLVACNGGAGSPNITPPGEAVLEVKETSVLEDAVAEPIYLNNCGNPASVSHVSTHSQAITIGGSAGLGVSGGVVSGSVEGKYSSTENVSKSLTVTAAPETNMKFVLLWTEKVSEGTVTAVGQSGEATYQVSVPISVELSSAEDLGCPASTPETSTPTLSPTPTSSPTPSPTPVPYVALTPEYACDTTNEQPSYGAEIKRGRKFKVSFTLVNTGSNTWPDGVKLVLDSNPYGTVDVTTPLQQIPRVQPLDMVDIGPFDAVAPEEPGYYVVSFELGDDICWPYISFNVVK